MKYAGLFFLIIIIPYLHVVANNPADHHIGARTNSGEGELYDVRTNEPFHPIGFNLIKLAQQNNMWGESFMGHATCMESEYEPEVLEYYLEKLKNDGYNTVRCFLSTECKEKCLGNMEGGLNAGFMENVKSFLDLCNTHGIYVIFTLDDVPQTPRFLDLIVAEQNEYVDGYNRHYLTRSGLNSHKLFWQLFIQDLLALNAKTENILAYELCNELYFENNHPPFSLNEGTYKTVNGKTYDLSDLQQKRDMLEENLVFWVDEITEAIKKIDPTGLVTVGFFQPQAPNPTRIDDPRIIYTSKLIHESKVDFVDLHAYPDGELSFAQYMENYGVLKKTEKPLILGEMGVSNRVVNDVKTATYRLLEWQAKSCEYGFDGWLIWTYGAYLSTEHWGGLDEEEMINIHFSPNIRNSFCEYPEPINKARNATVNVSNELEGYDKSYINDGIYKTDWNAGDFAPQWVELQLENPIEIYKIDLFVAMYPKGYAQHNIWVRKSGSDDYELLQEIKRELDYDEHISLTFENTVNDVESVKIETVKSPSWIGWYEIEIYEKTSVPDIPEIIQPVDGFVKNKNMVQFVWKGQKNASFYNFEIAADSLFNNIVYYNYTVWDTSLTIKQTFDENLLYWRLRSGSLEGTSEWTGPRLIQDNFIIQNIRDDHVLKVLCYPNPFSTVVRINIPQDATGNITLSLWNATGVLVDRKIFEQGASSNNQILYSNPYLPCGMYVIQINTRSKLYFGKIFHE